MDVPSPEQRPDLAEIKTFRRGQDGAEEADQRRQHHRLRDFARLEAENGASAAAVSRARVVDEFVGNRRLFELLHEAPWRRASGHHFAFREAGRRVEC